MLKICFHFEDFDIDVSSGTIHAAYQWLELALAFGVGEIAVINKTSEAFPSVQSEIPVREYPTMGDFLEANEGQAMALASVKDTTHYRSLKYSNVDWLVFGGTGKIETMRQSVHIPTLGNRELYPREAAAIILAEVAWQAL